MGRYGSVTGRHGTLRNVVEVLCGVVERYGALTERDETDTENIDFAHH